MLKYLFDVQFDDGSSYTQNREDVSVIEPEKRSCFFDVQRQIESGKKVEWFTLSDGDTFYAVNLKDGRFNVNGKEFFMHEERDLEDFRIIFFRQHTHNFNAGQELSHEIVYRMGWQITKDGKNIQRVMEIN